MRIVLGVGLALVLAGLTHTETARWQSDRTLWCAAAQQAPAKPRALNNCALARMRDGAFDEALPLLETASISLDAREPNRRAALRATVLTNRVLALYALRRLEEARATLALVDAGDPRAARLSTWLAP